MNSVAQWVRAVRALSLAGAFAAGLALAEAPKNPWHVVKSPSSGAPRAIGDYSAGCVSGAQPLPFDGEGYQVVHTNRGRYFGHPELLDFIRTLGEHAHAEKLGMVLVGDLGQPRGGPAPSGHASHQSGLDVDIWFWTPPASASQTLSAAERERVKGRSVLDPRTKSIGAQWVVRVTQLLRLTADDPRVERVFVNPIIKRTLCANQKTDRAWLSRLRPWYGHDDHFHVRLACPADSPDCKPQAKAPAGDGCDQLDWWFDEKAQADREQGKKDYETKVARKPPLPAQCSALIAEP
jgi:penicillin-insensitive murein endopeptidase